MSELCRIETEKPKDTAYMALHLAMRKKHTYSLKVECILLKCWAYNWKWKTMVNQMAHTKNFAAMLKPSMPSMFLESLVQSLGDDKGYFQRREVSNWDTLYTCIGSWVGDSLPGLLTPHKPWRHLMDPKGRGCNDMKCKFEVWQFNLPNDLEEEGRPWSVAVNIKTSIEDWSRMNIGIQQTLRKMSVIQKHSRWLLWKTAPPMERKTTREGECSNLNIHSACVMESHDWMYRTRK